MSRLNLGSLATRGGDYVTAEEEFARALAGLESSGHLDGMSQAYEHIANMHLKRGCPDAAIGAIEQRIKLAVTQKNVTAEADAWEQMAKALEQSGKTLEAMDALRNAYKTSRKPGTLRISDPGTIRPPKGQSK